MGCFACFGWAWNIKPDRSEVGQWAAAVPSAEFVESFVIFLYGCTKSSWNISLSGEMPEQPRILSMSRFWPYFSAEDW